MFAVPYLTVPQPPRFPLGGSPSEAPSGAPEHPPSGAGPAATALSLAGRPQRWRHLVEFHADTGWYRLLHDTGEQQIWLLSWLPGQGADLHDHGAAGGAFAVAVGTLTEQVVARSGPLTHQLTVGRARVFGPHYAHRVQNSDNEPAVSVHVYRHTSGLAAGSLRQLGLRRATDVVGGYRARAEAGLPAAPG